MKHTVTLSRFLILSGLSFPMSTGHSLESCLITRVSGMLGPTTWATRSSVDSAIIFFVTLSGVMAETEKQQRKSLLAIHSSPQRLWGQAFPPAREAIPRG